MPRPTGALASAATAAGLRRRSASAPAYWSLSTTSGGRGNRGPAAGPDPALRRRVACRFSGPAACLPGSTGESFPGSARCERRSRAPSSCVVVYDPAGSGRPALMPQPTRGSWIPVLLALVCCLLGEASPAAAQPAPSLADIRDQLDQVVGNRVEATVILGGQEVPQGGLFGWSFNDVEAGVLKYPWSTELGAPRPLGVGGLTWTPVILGLGGHGLLRQQVPRRSAGRQRVDLHHLLARPRRRRAHRAPAGPELHARLRPPLRVHGERLRRGDPARTCGRAGGRRAARQLAHAHAHASSPPSRSATGRPSGA